jgi:hypothetical protein
MSRAKSMLMCAAAAGVVALITLALIVDVDVLHELHRSYFNTGGTDRGAVAQLRAHDAPPVWTQELSARMPYHAQRWREALVLANSTGYVDAFYTELKNTLEVR